MTKSFIYIILFLFILSCGKDDIQTKPQLKIKSISNSVVEIGNDLIIKLRLTDKEGDFIDTIWLKKKTTRCIASDRIDSLRYMIPVETPRKKNFDGEVLITLMYALELQPRCNKADTAVFSFWMKDAKGHKSDTVKTQSIIIKR